MPTLLRGQESKETVVCIHGLLRTRMNMVPIARHLKKGGFRTVNWTYPSRKYPIHTHAEMLVNTLNSIAQENPGVPIHFATHSLGGIITRAALSHPNCPPEAKVGCAVLIAPPNRGSQTARSLYKNRLARKALGCHGAGHELMIQPPEHFETIGTFPETKAILIISGTAGITPLLDGPNDGKVTVAESCLDTPHEHETFLAGHSWICYDPRVIRRVREFLSCSRSQTFRSSPHEKPPSPPSLPITR